MSALRVGNYECGKGTEGDFRTVGTPEVSAAVNIDDRVVAPKWIRKSARKMCEFRGNGRRTLCRPERKMVSALELCSAI